jgi:hypothetical protein
MTDMNPRTHLPSLLGAGFLALGALALPLQAQSGGNGFTAFVGCWEPLDAGDEAGLLCFRPSGAGVEMFNVLDGDIVSSEQISADGSPRSVSAEGCTGFESASFSEDGFRVFTRSEFTCDGDIRAGSGVMSFIAPTQWVDVRSLEVEGEPVAWVQRYQLADADQIAEQSIDDPAAFDRTLVRAMRTRAAQDIEVEDVEEAVARVDARAVEVWVATHETELELSGSDLVRLADAGVPESVIDVMVAVSYPERFAVTPEGVEEAERMAVRSGYDVGYRRGFRSYLWGPYYRPMGYGYYGYSPFGYYGYGFGGYYGGYYGYRPATVIVQPVAPGSSGRMVPGRGYTRGSSSVGSGGAAPRSSVGSPAPSSSRSGGGAVRRSGGGSSSGSSGAATSSGSSGSSRSSTGRTAQPRGN